MAKKDNQDIVAETNEIVEPFTDEIITDASENGTGESETINKVIHFSKPDYEIIKNISKQLGMEQDEIVSVALQALLQCGQELLKEHATNKVMVKLALLNSQVKS